MYATPTQPLPLRIRFSWKENKDKIMSIIWMVMFTLRKEVKIKRFAVYNAHNNQ